MDLLFLIIAMILIGLLIGYLAGYIWKENRPIGVKGDYIAAILTTIIVGVMDWLVIPAMGFSNTMRWLGVIFEPAASALIVLWIIRKAKQ